MADRRTHGLDPDFRRNPKTDRYCYLCSRDLTPEHAAGGAVLVDEERDPHSAIHPDDATGTETRHLVGRSCARRVRSSFLLPESTP